MTNTTLFAGLDVHKKTISAAAVEASAGATVGFYRAIVNTPDSVRGLCRKLSRAGQRLHFAGEAGPCGYRVQRLLTRLGHRCEVVARRGESGDCRGELCAGGGDEHGGVGSCPDKNLPISLHGSSPVR